MGVPLKELISGTHRYQLEIYQDFWAFKDKHVVLSLNLSMQSDVMVADTAQWEETEDRSSILAGRAERSR